MLLWQQLEMQERADYIHGLFMSLNGRPERTAMTALKEIGLADGQAVTKAGIAFKANDAQLIWRVCRMENIGASQEQIDALRNSEVGSRLQSEKPKWDEEQEANEQGKG